MRLEGATVSTGDVVMSAMECGALRFRDVLACCQCLVIHGIGVTHCGCFAFRRGEEYSLEHCL